MKHLWIKVASLGFLLISVSPQAAQAFGIKKTIRALPRVLTGALSKARTKKVFRALPRVLTGALSKARTKAVKARAIPYSAKAKPLFKRLVSTKFGGDWDRAFRTMANRSNTDNTINREELLWALKQAGIGNWMTRGAWADGIIKELDKNSDRTISEREFNSVFRLDKGTSDKF